MASKRSKGNGRGQPKNLKQVIDPVFARALSHPLRSHILMTLGERVASPSEVAKELDMNARDLNYHFGILVEIGLIKLVRTEKRRGVLEHFYELRPPVFLVDDSEWSQLPEQIQSRFRVDLLRDAAQAAVDALRAGTFSGFDSHQSRITVILDEQGRRDVFALMEATLERVLDVHKECAKTLKARPQDGIPIEVFMMGFEAAAAGRQHAEGRAAGTG
jgi:DNA-binding transcriptional ArsR family regulator